MVLSDVVTTLSGFLSSGREQELLGRQEVAVLGPLGRGPGRVAVPAAVAVLAAAAAAVEHRSDGEGHQAITGAGTGLQK